VPERLLGWMERHWRLVVLLVWLLACALFTWQKWGGIVGFALGRYRRQSPHGAGPCLLNGQGWFDLRQYRFDPAFGGANIHWSRSSTCRSPG
jgi:hypothetical protein